MTRTAAPRTASRRRPLISRALLAALLLVPSAAAPQDSAPSPSGSRAAEETAPKLLLKHGTPVQLKLAQNVDAKYAVVGEPVELVLAEDLKVGDAVVVKQGARVIGTVTAGKQKDKRGEANALALRIDFLKSGANSIRLTGDSTASGKRNADQMVAGTILFGVTGLILTSRKHYAIPAGTSATAYVAEDTELSTAPYLPKL